MHHNPPGNCNYAGVLIIWDRLFGTFVSELEAAPLIGETIAIRDDGAPQRLDPEELQRRSLMFGLARPLNSYDPVYTNVHHLIRLVESVSLSVKHTQDFLGTTFLARLLVALLKKRVHHPFLVVLDLKRFAPDILQQMERFKTWKAFLNQLFYLPPGVSVSSVEQLVGATEKEKLFFANRQKREKGFPTTGAAAVAVAIFLATIVSSLYLLERFDGVYRSGSAIERTGVAVGILACFCSMHLLESLLRVESPSH
jgi:hypothetical protein